ncbi:unnamed protein product [marine sediment metagenome]|uniref:Uncharacterized protein n=1 Tax=marine sediment metagenome TaxID=412755 RepID=X1CVX1_9ZZZZ
MPKINEVIKITKIIYKRIAISGLSKCNLILLPYIRALINARSTNKSKGVKEKPGKKVYKGRRYSDMPEKSAKKKPGP